MHFIAVLYQKIEKKPKCEKHVFCFIVAMATGMKQY